MKWHLLLIAGFAIGNTINTMIVKSLSGDINIVQTFCIGLVTGLAVHLVWDRINEGGIK